VKVGAESKARPSGQPAAGAHSDAATREQILDAALEAFAERGFDGASTRSIATQAGVNQGLIPYYFGSKQALWREAVDRAFSSLHESMGELAPTGDASEGEALDEVSAAIAIRRYVAFVAAHPEFVCLMNEEGKRAGPRMEWLTERHVRPALAGLNRLMSGVRASSSRVREIDPIHFDYIFLGAASLIFHQAHECRYATGYDPMQPSAIGAHADALVELFLGDSSLGRPVESNAG
jgi:TetR/AcrR family transcriptional regulator